MKGGQALAEQNRGDGMREKRVAEQIWLEYFNSYLYEHGHITEKERNRMVSAIAADQNRKQQKETKQSKSCSDIELP